MKVVTISLIVLFLLVSCGESNSAIKLIIFSDEDIVPNTINKIKTTYVYYGTEIETTHFEEETEYQVSELPQTLVVHRGSIYNYGVRFWIDGYMNDNWIIAHYASSLFPGSGVKEIEVNLTEDCFGKCLSREEHCENGRCVSNIDPTFPELDAYLDP